MLDQPCLPYDSIAVLKNSIHLATASPALSKIKADTISCIPEYNKNEQPITGSVGFFNH